MHISGQQQFLFPIAMVLQETVGLSNKSMPKSNDATLLKFIQIIEPDLFRVQSHLIQRYFSKKKKKKKKKLIPMHSNSPYYSKQQNHMKNYQFM